MKRSNKKSCTCRNNTSFTCPGCSIIYSSMRYFRDHMKQHTVCRETSRYSCQFCKYIGYDENGLKLHISYSLLCHDLYDQKTATTGLMNHSYKATPIRKLKSPLISSFMLKHYSTIGKVKNTCLNMQYDTNQTRSSLINNTTDNISANNGYTLLKHG